MGTIFFIGCKDCKVYRDLDKFYDLRHSCRSRKDVLEFQKDISESPFRPALLISFLADHLEHNCIAFDENDELYEYICDERRGNKPIKWVLEDREFWTLTEEEKKSNEELQKS